MDIAEEFVEGTILEDGNLEGEDSESDEWKELDEETETPGWFNGSTIYLKVTGSASWMISWSQTTWLRMPTNQRDVKIVCLFLGFK